MGQDSLCRCGPPGPREAVAISAAGTLICAQRPTALQPALRSRGERLGSPPARFGYRVSPAFKASHVHAIPDTANLRHLQWGSFS
ncbi:hypothetical protein SKAU_G00430110 [Synaphobranchus kaupii]|uniref:Uncharacterized protein n=1 Tax=Synaphobranchus kaupii TaxID=118154 RepID=A0A9Q1E4F4_SYNKA|nr:hypothetical protein SKAU_G00430110 [Synaphobranchus kaupii]